MNIDLNDLSPAEIIELAYALIEDGEGMEKEASEELPDLNELSVDEFLDFAEGLEEALVESGEIEKVAGARWESAKKMGRSAGSRVLDAFKAGRARRAYNASAAGSYVGGGPVPKEFAEAFGKLRRNEGLKGAGEAAAAYGTAGGAAVGSYKGIQAFRKRDKKKGR